MNAVDPNGCDLGFPGPDQDASVAFGLHLTGSGIDIKKEVTSEETYTQENVHKGIKKLWERTQSGSIWAREQAGTLVYDKTTGKWKFIIFCSYFSPTKYNTFEQSWLPDFQVKRIGNMNHAYYNGDEIFSLIHTHPTHPFISWTGKFNDLTDNKDFTIANDYLVPSFVMTDNNIAYVDYRTPFYNGTNRYQVLGNNVRNDILNQKDAFINLTLKYSAKTP